jgi:UDP-N-acetyl-D-mannosaminuronic acid transferase (WecB/TagA/CpsF family)
LIETPNGLILLTREQLKARVRAELAGLDLVKELLAERRAQADAEDAA